MGFKAYGLVRLWGCGAFGVLESWTICFRFGFFFFISGDLGLSGLLGNRTMLGPRFPKPEALNQLGQHRVERRLLHNTLLDEYHGPLLWALKWGTRIYPLVYPSKIPPTLRNTLKT